MRFGRIVRSTVLLIAATGCGDCDDPAATKPQGTPMLLSEARELRTTEAGGVASFTLALSMQPTDTVVVPLSSSDETEGTVAPAQLTFTKDNWNAPQTVTITGVDDELADGA